MPWPRSSKAVRELGHAIDRSFALNLDPDHDEVAFRKQRLVRRFVGRNFGGESGVRLGKAKEIMYDGDGAIDEEGWGLGGESEID